MEPDTWIAVGMIVGGFVVWVWNATRYANPPRNHHYNPDQISPSPLWTVRGLEQECRRRAWEDHRGE